MLRLAPSHPPLWRTPSSMQLGSDGAVRLDEVTPWQERLLDALRDGIPDAMLLPLARSLGASATDAERFVAEISGALTTDSAEPVRVQAELPSEIGFAEADAFDHGWRAAGLDPASVTRWPATDPEPDVPMILVADLLVDPRRASTLMAADVTHLPVALCGDRVVVGPIVVPGATACLTCLHAHRTDDDAGWPLVAAQLIGRERTPTDTGLILEAAVLAARMLRAAPESATGESSVSVTLSRADVRRVWHSHRPHARCLCRSPEAPARSPEGIATPHADARSRSPHAPTTTVTGYARPA